ncbi:hypothetical protein D3C86_1709470 [compost metagenome]
MVTSSLTPKAWYSLGRPLLSFSLTRGSHWCLGTKAVPATVLRKGPNTRGSSNLTCKSSILVTLGNLPSILTPSTCRLSGKLGLQMISLKVKTTSSAVRGWPSDHLSPSRSLKTKVLLSGDTVQDSARPGSTAAVLGFASTRPSYMKVRAYCELTPSA